MRLLIALRSLGSALLVAAVTVLSLQVHVGGSGQSGRSCGSSLDVITDRAGWEVWYAQDVVDAAAGSPVALVRTLRCPDAVNGRTVAAGALGAAGAGALVAGAMLRRSPAGSPRPAGGGAVRRLRRLGAATTMVGAFLVAGGLSALAVLLADRESTIFIFVRRPLVAAIGAVVLAPVVALLVGGRAISILATTLQKREISDEAA